MRKYNVHRRRTMENRRKQLRVFFACFLRSSSRAQRAAQQLAANYYGFASFPLSTFVCLFFGPLSDGAVHHAAGSVDFSNGEVCTD